MNKFLAMIVGCSLVSVSMVSIAAVAALNPADQCILTVKSPVDPKGQVSVNATAYNQEAVISPASPNVLVVKCGALLDAAGNHRLANVTLDSKFTDGKHFLLLLNPRLGDHAIGAAAKPSEYKKYLLGQGGGDQVIITAPANVCPIQICE